MMKGICRDMHSFSTRRNLIVWESPVPKRCYIRETRKICKIITDLKMMRSKLFSFLQDRIL